MRLRKMRKKRELRDEGEGWRNACPWNFEQLTDACETFQVRYEGFWTRLDKETVRTLLRGFLVTTLFCCREEFNITAREIRVTYQLCEWILKVEDF